MFKVFRSYARFLLVAVITIKHLATTSTGKSVIIQSLSDWTNANPNHPAVSILGSFDWLNELDNPDSEVDEIIDNVLVGFEPQSTAGDYELITKVVDFLGLPWTSNRISVQTLGALRSAVLRPSEVAGFVKASNEALYCGSCHNKLSSDELLTFRQGKGLEPTIYCGRCSSPRFARCHACNQPAHISAGGSAVLTSSKLVSCGCGTTKAPAADSKSAVYKQMLRQKVGPLTPRAATFVSSPGAQVSGAGSILQTLQSLGSDPFGDGI